ncbi:MAG: DUF4129 domain-containing protein, partial [Bradymonadaceae bacterium]
RRLDPRLHWPILVGRSIVWSLLATGWLAVFVGLDLQTALGGLAVGAGSVVAASSWSLWRAVSAAPAPTRLFARIERAGRRADHPRRDGEPPAAYLQRLAGLYPDVGRQLHLFRHRYLAARFGGREFDRETRRNLEQSVAEICQQIE